MFSVFFFCSFYDVLVFCEGGIYSIYEGRWGGEFVGVYILEFF